MAGIWFLGLVSLIRVEMDLFRVFWASFGVWGKVICVGVYLGILLVIDYVKVVSKDVFV